MARLADIVLPEVEVLLPGGQSLSVRGLSYTDLAGIFQANGPILTKLFSDYIFQFGSTGTVNPDEIATALMTELPEVASQIILLANDADPEEADYEKAVETAVRLPGFVQTEALISIVQLTLDSEATVKKMFAKVLGGMEILNRTLATEPVPESPVRKRRSGRSGKRSASASTTAIPALDDTP